MKLQTVALCLGVALLVLGGAYAGYWYYVAGRLQDGIDAWVEQQRAAGNEVAIADGSIGGFPFAFRRDFGAAEMRLQGGVAARIAAGSAIAEIKPWNLNTVIVTARDVSVSGAPGIYKAAALDGSIDIPTAPPADYHQPLLEFDLTATDVTLPEGQRAVTAGPIEALAARGAIMGPVPMAPDVGQALAGWANAGGVLELKSFNFAQAPLAAAGEGTLALDEALQPLGALTLRAHGVAETVALLQQDGLLDARNAKTALLMVNGLAKPDEAGKALVKISLSLQEGFVWVGPIKLAPLPRLNW
ncbi:DUF2125 domain-containing protein [Dongia sp.]|uniref:DUF2125 domain-containing protein n=1 Tax=Dongia sp. TaxID=1977262 RepID=UPI0035AF5D0C